MFELCVLYSQDKKYRTVTTKKQVRIKYEQSTRDYKKFSVWGTFPVPLQTGPVSHPASYKIGTRSLSRGKDTGAWR